MFCEQILSFTKALHHGKWQEAEQAVARLAAINKWESQLRYGGVGFICQHQHFVNLMRLQM
jgi:hypothetical protein